MGVGFVLGGYCPGTSLCGAAVGRIDAMAFAGGGVLGIFVFGEAFPLLENFYKAGSKGDLLALTALGLSNGQFAGIMIAVAVAAFILTTRLEKKVNPQSGAFSFPVTRHRLAGGVLLALGLALAIVPDHKVRLTAQAADPVTLQRQPVRLIVPDELAIHIMDRDPKFQLIDVRDSADFGKATLPDAVNIPASALFGKESWNTLTDERTVKVFFGKNTADGLRAAALARLTGHENVAALEGGLDGFTATVLNASTPRQGVDNDTYAFRVRASGEIAAMMRQRSATRPVKPLRRVQGGCGG